MSLTKEARRAALLAEDAFVEAAEGWEIHRNGWPDFLCVAGKRAIAVEVKSGNAGLTREQSEVMNVLASSGISCYVWHPSRGLTLYQAGFLSFPPSSTKGQRPIDTAYSSGSSLA